MRIGIRVAIVLAALAALALCVDSLVPVSRAGDSEELTPAAAAAVEELFPGATSLDVEQEREDGVRFYEVELRDGDETIEIEITAEGRLLTVEDDDDSSSHDDDSDSSSDDDDKAAQQAALQAKQTRQLEAEAARRTAIALKEKTEAERAKVFQRELAKVRKELTQNV